MRKRDDFLSCLRAELVQSLGRLPEGTSPQRAQETAQAVVQRLARRYRGERVYIREARYDADAVLRDFQGANHAEVCQRHGLSRRTLERLVKQQRRGGSGSGSGGGGPIGR